MKQTGPTKKSTRELVRQLEKKSTSSKQAIWKTVSAALQKPRRQRVQINLEKLERLAARFSNKTFIVAGKVLASGNLTTKLKIAAFEYSQSAKTKIKQAGGECQTLHDLLEQKQTPAELMIVK